MNNIIVGVKMACNSNLKLVLFTEYYPYSAVAESFLDIELFYLSQTFDSIEIVPRVLPNDIERMERILPNNVFVHNSLLKSKKIRKSLKAINYAFSVGKTKYFYKEILRRPKTLIEISSMMRLINYLYEAIRIHKWILQYIKHENMDLSRTVFYTYWMNPATLGIGMAKKKYPKIKLVSRAHGGDLYEERHSPPYLPFRLESFQVLDRLYLISDHGKTYLTKRHHILNTKCSVSRLGVRIPNSITKSSSDGIFRIISCSYVIPVKRIHRIILALKILGLRRSELKIEWIHIGYGQLLEKMERCAFASLPKNVVYKFLGLLQNSEVISFYEHNPIDVFINVSASEGIPVSIMEAQSFGIPVIASAVGGTPEIVSDKVGLLLSENPSPIEIANALEFFLDHPDITRKMRLNSISNWNSNFNATKNFTDFANNLKML